MRPIYTAVAPRLEREGDGPTPCDLWAVDIQRNGKTVGSASVWVAPDEPLAHDRVWPGGRKPEDWISDNLYQAMLYSLYHDESGDILTLARIVELARQVIPYSLEARAQPMQQETDYGKLAAGDTDDPEAPSPAAGPPPGPPQKE